MPSIACIGDIHARPDARNAERYRILDTIVGELEARHDIGLVVLLGDLNDRAMTIFDKNAQLALTKRIRKRWPLVIVKGNHDKDGDLDYLAHVEAELDVQVVTDARCVRMPLMTGGFATLFVLAYPDKARLVAAGASKTDVVAVGADLFEPMFMAAAGELQAARARGDVTLMVGHLNIGGAVTSAGQPNIGRELELSPRHLDRLGAIPKIFGHIHRGQELHDAWYAGSICRQNWGEVEEKRYLVAHCEPGDSVGKSYQIESVPIDVAPLWHIEGELTRDGFTWAAKAGDDGEVLEPPASWRGHEVRVRYRYRASEKPILSEAPILATFAEARRLKVEACAVPDRDVRAPEVAAARTLRDKVAAVLKIDALEASLADDLAALEQGDAVQLLADVDAFIGDVEGSDRMAAA